MLGMQKESEITHIGAAGAGDRKPTSVKKQAPVTDHIQRPARGHVILGHASIKLWLPEEWNYIMGVGYWLDIMFFYSGSLFTKKGISLNRTKAFSIFFFLFFFSANRTIQWLRLLWSDGWARSTQKRRSSERTWEAGAGQHRTGLKGW